jgi:two-component system cell cycle sensor histidine kinase/response regulator CckA
MQERTSWPKDIDPGAAFDAMSDSVVVFGAVRDEQGVIVDFRFEFLNAAAATAFASLGTDLIGRRMLDVFPTMLTSGLSATLRTLVETSKPLAIELPWSDPVLGESTWEIWASPLGDGFIAVVRDRTEQTRLMLESRERELRYRLLADHVGDVAVLSKDRLIEWVGPSSAELLGWNPEELLGRTVISLVHVDDVDRLMSFRTGLGPDAAQRVRVRVEHKSGGYRWMEVSSRILPTEGLRGSVVSVMWSVDAEVEALEALQRAEAERAQMERRMQQAARLESLGVLAGGIAHDFNNLLVGVLGNAELARQRIDQPDALIGLLDQLVAAGERAAELTTQMLDYVGQRSVAPKPVHVGELVTETMGLLRPNLASNAMVHLLVDASLPAVIADPTQLRQAVMNLVINASDALDGAPGEVKVSVEARDVEEAEIQAVAPLNPPAAGRFVVVEVRDTGRGMNDETLSRMFEPFFTTTVTGRGLGLSVVHGAVRSMGGVIEASSEVGAGTSMRIYLPAQPDDVTMPPPVVTPAPPVERTTAGTVLVVDDEPIVSAMIRRVLESADHPVLVMSGAEAALEAFRSCPQDFSMALLDMTMPGMNGLELSAALHLVRSDLPILLMSGYTAEDIGVELTDPRFSFVAKPFRLEALLDAVAAAANS